MKDFSSSSTNEMVGHKTFRLRLVLPRGFEQFSSARFATSIPCQLLGECGCDCVRFAAGEYTEYTAAVDPIKLKENWSEI